MQTDMWGVPSQRRNSLTSTGFQWVYTLHSDAVCGGTAAVEEGVSDSTIQNNHLRMAS